MDIRIMNQIRKYEANKKPDNRISFDELTDLDISMLKKVFSRIGEFQTKLKVEYKIS